MPITKKSSKKATNQISNKKVAKKSAPAKKVAVPAAPVKKAVKKTKPVEVVKTKRVSKKVSSTKNASARKPPSMSVEFGEGTDMYTAFQELQKGGESRTEVSNRLVQMWAEHLTRNGNRKPVSTIINHVVRRARQNGYVIEQTWRLVKPDEAASTDEVPAVAKKTARKATKVAATPAKAVKKAVKRRTKP